MYARVTKLRFPPAMSAEVAGAAQGLVPVLYNQPGFGGLDVLMQPGAGEGIIVSFWETEAAAEAGERNPSYVGQMSMMSSFLHDPLVPETYQVNVRT